MRSEDGATEMESVGSRHVASMPRDACSRGSDDRRGVEADEDESARGSGGGHYWGELRHGSG